MMRSAPRARHRPSRGIRLVVPCPPPAESIPQADSASHWTYARIIDMLSLEGRIIEFLDAEQLRVAYVRKQDHDRLHVIDPRGRNISVSGDRVVVVHRPASEGEFPAIARQISDKVSAR